MLTQTWAIFLDAYRELNAKKLFWFTLGLSGLIVLAFAAVGINEDGLYFLRWRLTGGLNTTVMPPDLFYKSVLFLPLGVKLWLAWGAIILALVSTAGVFPDFVASGSLPAMLAKPVSRTRLFLTKYATGLLFVALQVSVFCVASFFVLGLRGGLWEWKVFLAIPLVLAMFSYLFCVCALLGLMTRSTIAALLLTLLFWFALFLSNTTERTLLAFEMMQQQRVQSIEQRLTEERTGADAEQPEALTVRTRLRGVWREAGRPARIEALESALVDARQDHADIRRWRRLATGVKTALPKTTETIDLLERTMVSDSELDALLAEEDAPPPSSPFSGPTEEEQALGVEVDQGAFQREYAGRLRDRSAWWILGTSLAFEALVLAFAAWWFSRRDY